LVLRTNYWWFSNHVVKVTGAMLAIFILNFHVLAAAEDGLVRYPLSPKKERIKLETPSPPNLQPRDFDTELESRGYVFFPPREKTQSAPQPKKASEKRTVENSTETRTEVVTEKPDTDKQTIEPAKNANRLVITPNVRSVSSDSTRGNVGITSSTQVSPVGVSPTIEFRFDEETKAQFSENHWAIQYRDKGSETSAGIQITRDSLGNTYMTGRAGAILNEQFAVGTHFSTSERRHDINLSAAVLMNSNRIQIRSSVGIMRGTQGGNFESGYSDVDLQQVSKLLSLNYLPTLSDSQILELVGVNFWDSRATQLSNLDGIYLVRETPTSYDTYYDPRRLSEGSINGISGKIKLRIHDRIRIDQSFGRERLYFPFSDGSYEESFKLYSNTVMKANIGDKSLLTLGVSSGAYERKARVELSYDGLVFSFLNSQGLAGQKDYWSAGVQYNLLPFKHSGVGARNTNSPNLNLTSSSALLEVLSSRPVEFPHTFTVKTDPTSVRLVSSITKGTITWRSSGVIGTFNDSNAPSRQSVSIQLDSINSSGYAVDYDTTLVSGALPPGLTLSASGLISGTAAEVTSDTAYTFQVKAKSSGAYDVTSPNLSIIIKAPNPITWVSSGSLGTFFDFGSPSRIGINRVLSATSASGDPITYSTTLVSGSLPPGLSLSSSGVISGTATSVVTDTTFTFRVSASTPNSGATSSGDLSITIKAPVLVKFTTSGVTILSGSPTVTSNSITLPTGLSAIRLALVGGGGGGGAGNGGGGGSGQVIASSSYEVTDAQTVTLNVGTGGQGASTSVGFNGGTVGQSGNATNFGSVFALGGGGGGGYPVSKDGQTGGSGGGGAESGTGGTAANACPNGFVCYGNFGGSGGGDFGYPGGGGGGAGSNGASAIGSNPSGAISLGTGGNALVLPTEFGGLNVGGGGGGGHDGDNLSIKGVPAQNGAQGGSGVGGSGSGIGVGENAIADTGSGGGGGASGWIGAFYSTQFYRFGGGNGSDGLVVVSY
jgi:hypothetical protein